jgi:hypothetical protein
MCYTLSQALSLDVLHALTSTNKHQIYEGVGGFGGLTQKLNGHETHQRVFTASDAPITDPRAAARAKFSVFLRLSASSALPTLDNMAILSADCPASTAISLAVCPALTTISLAVCPAIKAVPRPTMILVMSLLGSVACCCH